MVCSLLNQTYFIRCLLSVKTNGCILIYPNTKKMTSNREKGKGIPHISEQVRKRWKQGPLRAKILALRRNSFSLFVSNLPAEISKTEVEAMFHRAGRISDVFIPYDQTAGKNRGFGFVTFKTEIAALHAIELVSGRSWGERKITATLARQRELKRKSPANFLHREARNPWIRASDAGFQAKCASLSEGWLVNEGLQKLVRAAYWVVEEEKKLYPPAWWIF